MEYDDWSPLSKALTSQRTPQKSTSTISRIPKRTEQKRHMIVLLRISNRENDCNFAIKAFDALSREVSFRIKSQSVRAFPQRKSGGHQSLNPAV